MKTIRVVLGILVLLLSGCAAQDTTYTEAQATPAHTENFEAPEETALPSEAMTDAEPSLEEESNTAEDVIIEMEDTMRLLIGETEVPVTWEENASVDALRALCPVTIQMSMYGGFEQVGSIGQSIVRNDEQTSTDYGDIVLYSGNQIVIFYGSNSWAYTRLGHVNLSQREMQDLLSGGDVSITLE